MGNRKIIFTNGEIYHIFSRGIDKRQTFLYEKDLSRFFQSMNEFNTVKPIGSLYENSFRKNPHGGEKSKSKSKCLVKFICYCINPNHYHFVLRQNVNGGISEFMKRLGGGYTKYFNKKYNRTGALFQGPFKSSHINSNKYLLHISAYVNLNDKVHSLGGETSKLSMSSWGEYLKKSENKNNKGFCEKEIVLGQFKNIEEYKSFAKSSLVDIKERKEMQKILLE